MRQDLAIAFAGRIAVGLVLAFAAGVAAFFVGWLVILVGVRSFSVLTPSIVTIVGAGSGLGSALAWIIPGTTRRRLVSAFLLAFVAALAGAWIGFLVGSPSTPVNLVRADTLEAITFGPVFQELITRDGLQAAMIGSGVGANLVGGAAYLFIGLRHREY